MRVLNRRLSRRPLVAAAVSIIALCGARVRGENAITVGRGEAAPGEVASVPILISSDEPFHGFVIAMTWDESSGRGEALVPRDGPGELLESADLVVTQVSDGSMIFGVSMDADSADCEKIPAGDNFEVGEAQIRCLATDAAGPQEHAITLVDEQIQIGDPAVSVFNTLLVFGEFVWQENGGLTLRHGAFVCSPTGGGEAAFACGGELDAAGSPSPLEAELGGTTTVNFYYRSADPVQGLSMSVRYDCALSAIPESLNTTGTALESSEAEFVNLVIDNDNSSTDGDGCGLTMGILIDSNPPFDGRTLPAAAGFAKLFSVDFRVGEDAFCGECLPLRFTDGEEANDGVAVKNLISVDFEARPVELFDCDVCVTQRQEFVRGDCNFSGMTGMAIDISDAAAAAGFIFLEGEQKFLAPCEDACDANDDGRLDASDIVFLLEYLFVPAQPEPPTPGPLMPGVDPTADELGCEGGSIACS